MNRIPMNNYDWNLVIIKWNSVKWDKIKPQGPYIKYLTDGEADIIELAVPVDSQLSELDKLAMLAELGERANGSISWLLDEGRGVLEDLR